MSESLAGKTAIVTGSSKGIGKAIAFSLARSGVKVTLAARHREGLDPVEKVIRDNGGQCIAVRADISEEADVARLIETSTKAFGTVDILVNNAGHGIFSKVADSSVEEFDGMMKVNLRGVYLCCKAVIPIMTQQKSGAIINIASLAGKNSFVGGAIYSATKWGLIGFSRSLMLEVRDSNIRVVSICPGSVNTSFSDHSKDSEKIIQPQDVADTVLFALSMPARSNVSEIDIRPTISPRS